MKYTDPYMNFVMNPPPQDQAKYDMYVPSVSTMKVVSGNGGGQGLGDVPVGVPGIGVSVPGVAYSSGNDWVMPVVIIVVSAMALMTLYAVLSKR